MLPTPIPPPDTPLTAKLRIIWEVNRELSPDSRSFDEWYADTVCEYRSESTGNGQALAAILFDRALKYWPTFFRPSDAPAVALWGNLIDDTIPFADPEVIIAAVDAVAVHVHGGPPAGPADFITAAQQFIDGRA